MYLFKKEEVLKFGKMIFMAEHTGVLGGIDSVKIMFEEVFFNEKTNQIIPDELVEKRVENFKKEEESILKTNLKFYTKDD